MMRRLALVLGLAFLASVGGYAAHALASDPTTGSVTASIPDQVVTIPGTSTVVTYTIPTVTETVTVTVGTTTVPPPPPPPPPPPVLGASLPSRMPESSASSEVFLSPTGSDSNAGTSAAPVKSLQAAFNKASAGTVIEVRGNAGAFTATSNNVTSHCSFSPLDPVTVRSYPGDPEARFESAGSSNNVYFGNCSGVRLQGMVFDSSHTQNCLKVDSVVHFEIDGDIFGPCGASAATGAQGLMIGSSASGVGTSTVTSDLQVWSSLVYNWSHNPSSLNNNQGIYAAVMTKGVIANNVVYNTINGGGYGIQLGGEADNSYVVNNTVDGVTSTVSYGGSGIVVWGSTSEKTLTPTYNNVIEGNLFTNEKSYGAADSGSTTGRPLSFADYNLTFNDPSGAFRTGSMFTLGTHNVSGNPLYAGAHDYHLQPGSPAGSPACHGNPAYTPPLDKDGSPRACATLGAYGS